MCKLTILYSIEGYDLEETPQRKVMKNTIKKIKYDYEWEIENAFKPEWFDILHPDFSRNYVKYNDIEIIFPLLVLKKWSPKNYVPDLLDFYKNNHYTSDEIKIELLEIFNFYEIMNCIVDLQDMNKKRLEKGASVLYPKIILYDKNIYPATLKKIYHILLNQNTRVKSFILNRIYGDLNSPFQTLNFEIIETMANDYNDMPWELFKLKYWLKGYEYLERGNLKKIFKAYMMDVKI